MRFCESERVVSAVGGADDVGPELSPSSSRSGHRQINKRKSSIDMQVSCIPSLAEGSVSTVCYHIERADEIVYLLLGVLMLKYVAYLQ